MGKGQESAVPSPNGGRISGTAPGNGGSPLAAREGLHVMIGDRPVGPGEPVYVVAEIGINHNGDLELAHELVDAAYRAGCDAVKFQKRNPEECVPRHMRDRMRETPWGTISYTDYRRRVELDEEAYRSIDGHCRQRGLDWFASCWDLSSVDFMQQFDPPCFKIQSAAITDHRLLERLAETARTLVLSTGMSTSREIAGAVELLEPADLLILHCTSTYPCPPEELNLSVIQTLSHHFSHPVGYSGHEEGLATTVAAVALGACYVERHLTLDCSMWGSDHAASLEPDEFARLVTKIRTVEKGLGDGRKRIYESELEARRRLRRSHQDLSDVEQSSKEGRSDTEASRVQPAYSGEPGCG